MEKGIPPSIICTIMTSTHKLNDESFQLLKDKNAPFKVSNITENSLTLIYTFKPTIHKNIDHFIRSSHLIFSIFIMSLNVATLGYFNWKFAEVLPLYGLINVGHKKILGVSLGLKFKSTIEIVDITPNNIRKAFLLFGALGSDKESVLVQEYLKGILHINLSFLYFDFAKEAFGNFYRSFENIATEKILKVKKLINELKQLQNALRKVEAPETIVNEFQSLYILRSNQVMHAQKKQVNIEIDDVLKMKTIVDLVVHQVYKPVWTEAMEKISKNKK